MSELKNKELMQDIFAELSEGKDTLSLKGPAKVLLKIAEKRPKAILESLS